MSTSATLSALPQSQQAESIQGMGHVLKGFPVELAVRLAAVLIGQFRDALVACLAVNSNPAASAAETAAEATNPSKSDIAATNAPMANGSNGGSAIVEGIPAPSANGSNGGSAPSITSPQPSTNGSNGGFALAPRAPQPSTNGSVGAPLIASATPSPMANGLNGNILEPETLAATVANRASAAKTPSANVSNGGDDEDDDLGEWLGLSQRVADPVGDILRLVR